MGLQCWLCQLAERVVRGQEGVVLPASRKRLPRLRGAARDCGQPFRIRAHSSGGTYRLLLDKAAEEWRQVERILKRQALYREPPEEARAAVGTRRVFPRAQQAHHREPPEEARAAAGTRRVFPRTEGC